MPGQTCRTIWHDDQKVHPAKACCCLSWGGEQEAEPCGRTLFDLRSTRVRVCWGRFPAVMLTLTLMSSMASVPGLVLELSYFQARLGFPHITCKGLCVLCLVFVPCCRSRLQDNRAHKTRIDFASPLFCRSDDPTSSADTLEVWAHGPLHPALPHRHFQTGGGAWGRPSTPDGPPEDVTDVSAAGLGSGLGPPCPATTMTLEKGGFESLVCQGPGPSTNGGHRPCRTPRVIC